MIVIGIERSPASASWSLKSLSSALPELTEPASPIVNVGCRAATVSVVGEDRVDLLLGGLLLAPHVPWHHRCVPVL